MAQHARQVSLMFSGGVDSTATALLLADEYDRVHLLTYSNGFGHYRIGRTRRRAAELDARKRGKFVHTVRSVEPLFRRLVVESLEDDFARFGSGFVWCLGCKLAMHAESVVYNRIHGVSRMADGSSRDTSEMVEQMLVSLYLIRRFYSRHGIDFHTPVYTKGRRETIEFLRGQGVRMGLRVRDRFLGIQPKCKPGEIYYLPYLLFNQPPKHDRRRVAEFIESRIPVLDAYVGEALSAPPPAARGNV